MDGMSCLPTINHVAKMLTPTAGISCLTQVQRQMMDILQRTINVQSEYAVDNGQLLHVVFYQQLA